MQEAGIEPARIAERLHVDLADVQSAIEGFNAARAAASSSIVETVFNTEALIGISGAGDRLQAAQQAVRFTGAYNNMGDPIFEPDHQLALEAIGKAKDIAESMRPKSGGGNINIGINNQPGNGNAVGQVKTFEQRVREKRGVLPDSDVKFLSDGQGNEIVDGAPVMPKSSNWRTNDDRTERSSTDGEITGSYTAIRPLRRVARRGGL
jgi:hypothetical protein